DRSGRSSSPPFCWSGRLQTSACPVFARAMMTELRMLRPFRNLQALLRLHEVSHLELTYAWRRIWDGRTPRVRKKIASVAVPTLFLLPTSTSPEFNALHKQ